MLHAILKGKAARVSIDGKDISWRELFREREDLLTAAFFGRFPYLSGSGHECVLQAILGNDLADSCGDYRDIEFWPHFYEENGKSFVEPDVVLYFQHAILVVEVKPPKGGVQHEDQWRREISSVITERARNDSFREIPGRIIFLALGRNHGYRKSMADNIYHNFKNEDLHIRILEWIDIGRFLSDMIENLDFQRSVEKSDLVIYADWISALCMYGINESRRPFLDLMAHSRRIDMADLRHIKMWNISFLL